jgi:hypothetical protein
MSEHTAENDALRAAAVWVAESIGYPVECKMPDDPMPQALWDALVDHVHADVAGKWHGNDLDREDTESWLADEAGRVIPPGEDDADLADTLRARLAADDGIRHDLDDVIEEFGFTREELEDDLPRVIPSAVGDAS